MKKNTPLLVGTIFFLLLFNTPIFAQIGFPTVRYSRENAVQSIWDCNLMNSGLLTQEAWAPRVFPIMNSSHLRFFQNPTVANENIVLSGEKEIWILDREGRLLPGFPWQLFPADENGVLAMPAVGDLDNDGIKEFVVVGYDFTRFQGQIWVFAQTEQSYAVMSQWRFSVTNQAPFPLHYLPPPVTIADVTGDQNKEIVVSFARQVHLWNSVGEEQNGFPFEYRAPSQGNPDAYGSTTSVATAELNETEGKEIVVVTGDGNTLLLSAQGVELWRVITGRNSMSPVVGDVDQDGQSEVVIVHSPATRPVYISIIGSNGVLERRWSDSLFPFSLSTTLEAPTLASIQTQRQLGNTQRVKNIVLRNDSFQGDNFLNGYLADGRRVRGWPHILGPTASNVTALDICRDQRTELVMIGQRNFDSPLALLLFSSNGRLVQEISLQAIHNGQTLTASRSKSPAVLADVDRDGKTEIIFSWIVDPSPEQTGFLVIDAFEVQLPNEIEWAQFQGNFALTGTRE